MALKGAILVGRDGRSSLPPGPAMIPGWRNDRRPAMAGEPETAADPHELSRFVAAQADDYDQALAEITCGRKTSHWMWYVFPQVEGLGFSSMSRRYSIKSLDEARAYLDHPVLGPRL